MSDYSTSRSEEEHHRKKYKTRVKQRVIKYRLRNPPLNAPPKASSASTIEKYLNDVNDSDETVIPNDGSADRTLMTLFDMLELDQKTRDFCMKLNYIKFPSETEWRADPTNPEVPTAASLPQLLLCLTDPDNNVKGFHNDFIITIPSFTTPNVVLGAIFARFFADTTKEGCNITEEKLKTVRSRILGMFQRVWVRYAAFQLTNPQIFKALEFFSESVLKLVGPSSGMVIKSALKTLEGKTGSVQFNTANYEICTTPGLPESEWTLLNIPEVELVRQINYFHMTQFFNILPLDLLDAAWGSKTGYKAKNIEDMTNHFNDFSCFVSRSIINHSEDPHERARILKRWIDVAYLCLHPDEDTAPYTHFVNFHAVFAIVYGLTHRAIQRLAETQKFAAKTNKSRQNHFQEMKDLTDLVGGFKTYREQVADAVKCVPFMGAFQKDLVYITEFFPNEIDGLINFNKCSEIVKLYKFVEKYQERTNIIPNLRIQELIRKIPKAIDVVQLMQESQKVEPKK